MMKDWPLVSIVLPITEFEAGEYLKPFLQSVFRLDYQRSLVEIILRDNGLKKDTIRRIKRRYPKIVIVRDGRNVYYAMGINEAAKTAKGVWLYVGNTDTLLDKNCLRQLVLTAESKPSIAIVGPKVFSMDRRDEISRRDLPVSSVNFTLGILHNLSISQLLKLKEVTDVVWVSGCGFLVRRGVWEKLFGFDERFLIYWEDADLGVRARRLGYRAVVAPAAKIWHKGSAVMGVVSPQKAYYQARSTLYFWSKYLNKFGKGLMVAKIGAGCLIKLGKTFVGIDRETTRAYLLGIVDFIKCRFERRYERYEGV